MSKDFDEDVISAVRVRMLDFAKASFIERYPDIRDGLKPIHRRIIYSMHKLGLTTRSSPMKCARVVGDIMGKYHPHGDSSIYGTLVAMAQPFTINNPIVDGIGNFGSLLGDGAAAYRYTECRFTEYSKIFTRDLSKESVHYIPNYDNKLFEPSVLPTIVPNLLINGSYTIGAAAFNSSIPPHNLAEIVDLTIKLIQNPKLTNSEIGDKLLPDFPFGGIIINPEEIREFYKNGTPTTIKMTSKYYIDREERKIHVTELPYQVDGSTFKESIIKKFPKLREVGIEAIDDECAEESMDIIISYMKTADPDKIVSLLQKKARMSNSTQLIFTCTIDGRLMENISLIDFFREWIKFRRETIRKIIMYSIQELYRRIHILEALIISFDKIKDIIKIIETASSKEEIHNKLISNFRFTILQAQAIGSMTLYDLSRMGKDKLIAEHKDCSTKMANEKIKLSGPNIDALIVNELLDAKKSFGRPRRTQIIRGYAAKDETSNIEEIETVVALSNENTIAYMRKNKILESNTCPKIPTGSKDSVVTKVVSYTSGKDDLFVISNQGFMYKIVDVDNVLKNASVELPRWELIKLNLPLKLNEKIISIFSLSKSDFENRLGYFIFTYDNNTIKRSLISTLPKRLGQTGTSICPFNGVNVNLAEYVPQDKCDNRTSNLLYVLEDGTSHRYYMSQLRDMGKTAAGIQATPSESKIVDVKVYDDKDIVSVFTSFGKYSIIEVDEIPIKSRNVRPYRLLSKTSKNTVEKLTSIGYVPVSSDLPVLLVCASGSSTVVSSKILSAMRSTGFNSINMKNIDTVVATLTLQ